MSEEDGRTHGGTQVTYMMTIEDMLKFNSSPEHQLTTLESDSNL